MKSRLLLGVSLVIGVGMLATGASGQSPAFTPGQRSYWSWRAPKPQPVPAVKRKEWVKSPIDAFILAELEKRSLSPSPPATADQLLRRVAFDLTGLPPTAAEIDRYRADTKPGAYGRMVDRYLASPRFGERWARHWLDLARYADSNGYEFDEIRPNAWRYRDYVIAAFNHDKPYDRFLREQLAGDELFPELPEARIATGFNLLGPDMTDAADQAARRLNTLNDMTDTAGLAVMGLTIGCARCHDHKYEPLTQRDYFSLQAHFTGMKFRTDLPAFTPEQEHAHRAAQKRHEDARLRAMEDARPLIEAFTAERVKDVETRRGAELRAALKVEPRRRTIGQQNLVEELESARQPKAEELRDFLKAQGYLDHETVYRQLKGVEALEPAALPLALAAWEDDPNPPPTYLLERGEPGNRREEVKPGFPVILPTYGSGAPKLLRHDTPGRRAALAMWLTDPRHPLTSRVYVNRVWQHLFGRGIVATPSDFGLRGASPTHPELLDWLATEFAAGTTAGARTSQSKITITIMIKNPNPGGGGLSWSTKRLIRLIVNSAAYRQASAIPHSALRIPHSKDPENEWFGRQNRKRLEAEAIRDAALAASERLSFEMGGPGVKPPDGEGMMPKPAAAPAPDATPVVEPERRSVYLLVRRNRAAPELEPFDSPDTNLSCPRRETSTTAPQALALLNSAGMQENARALACRVLTCAKTDQRRLNLAYHLTLCRPPTPKEQKLALEFLTRQSGIVRSDPEAEKRAPVLYPKGVETARAIAWTDFCLALMNLNEFIYVD